MLNLVVPLHTRLHSRPNAPCISKNKEFSDEKGSASNPVSYVSLNSQFKNDSTIRSVGGCSHKHYATEVQTMRLLLHGRLPASMLVNRLQETCSNVTCLLLSGWTETTFVSDDLAEIDDNDMADTTSAELGQALLDFMQSNSGMDEIILQNCSGQFLKRLMVGILQSSPATLTIRYDKQQDMPFEIAKGLIGTQTRIEQLNLRGITLTPLVMEVLQLALPEYFRSLEALSVKGNILIQDVDRGVSILGSLDDDSSSYFAIEDSANRMTSLLLELPNLKCLELEYCHLEDTQLAQLLNAALSSSDIEIVKLRGNQCQENTMRVLTRHLTRKSCTVKTLDLTWQRLPLPTVSKKNVYRPTTALEGMPLLAKALAINTSLRTLILSENKLREMDMDLLASSLESNKTLRRLELKDCRLKSDSIFFLARSLPKMHLQSLHIDGTQRMSQEEKTLKAMFLAPLTNNSQLVDLSMNCQSKSIEQRLALNRATTGRQQPTPHSSNFSWRQEKSRSHHSANSFNFRAISRPASIAT